MLFINAELLVYSIRVGIKSHDISLKSYYWLAKVRKLAVENRLLKNYSSTI